jgi:hypothetical protein
MGRPGSLAILAAVALGAGPARGAEVTRVLSSGEPGSPFAFSLDVRYDRIQRTAKITRELGDNRAGQPTTGLVRDAAELDYSQVTDRVVPRLAVGLWRDLELRVQMPYVIDDTPHWDYGTSPARSAIDQNRLDPSGGTCAGVCPMFPVGRKLHAGGAFDDLQVGIAWALTNERRDAWSPTWVLSLDVTAPTAARYDPAAGRLNAATYPASFFDAPGFGSGKKAAVGQKIWVYDVATAFSKRLGSVEPYIQARLRIPQRSSATYSNCEHAAELAALPDAQMSSVAAQNCASAYWKKRAEAQPPMVASALLGAELVPFEDQGSARRFSVDLRVGGDFHGRGRWYNELTPATGKLLANDAWFDFVANAGLAYRTGHALLGLRYAFQHDFSHFITGEAMGHVSNEIVTPGSPQQNPNFDFRWDVPGRRFRVGNSTTHSLSAELAFIF